MPDAAARRLLWQHMFRGEAFSLASDIDFGDPAAGHGLAGVATVSLLHRACLTAVERKPPIIQAAEITTGIDPMKCSHYLSR